MTFSPDSALVDAVFASGNIEPRREVSRADMLVLHYTGMTSGAAAIDWLARPESKVSCHYVVDTDGRITQMVPEALRAWHAGVSCWQGETDINSRSIGIEIQNPGHELGYHPFTAAQMDAVAALSLDIVRRNGIPPERVLAHSDVAPQRKIDPGERFDWAYLHRRGVGAWVEPSVAGADRISIGPGDAGGGVRAVQALLAAYGYDVPVSGVWCAATGKVAAAFQRHYCPALVDGCFDLAALATLERLVATYTTKRSRPEDLIV